MGGACHRTTMRLIGFEDLVERRANLGVVNAVLIDEKPFEDGIVQAATRCVVRPSVKRTDICEERQAFLE
tara:strand:- start:74 stop:283 length:210 start_codon:yes stop_codon:yes gene_type:complete